MADTKNICFLNQHCPAYGRVIKSSDLATRGTCVNDHLTILVTIPDIDRRIIGQAIQVEVEAGPKEKKRWEETQVDEETAEMIWTLPAVQSTRSFLYLPPHHLPAKGHVSYSHRGRWGQMGGPGDVPSHISQGPGALD